MDQLRTTTVFHPTYTDSALNNSNRPHPLKAQHLRPTALTVVKDHLVLGYPTSAVMPQEEEEEEEETALQEEDKAGHQQGPSLMVCP